MSQGIQFIDIIFLGLVAGFLILRLRSVLGRRTGNERPPQEGIGFGRFNRRKDGEDKADRRDDNVVELPGRHRALGGDDEDYAEAGPRTPLDAGLTQIRLADPSFDPDQFLGGARMAFEMIVDAFAKGNTDTLRPLLADDVFGGFAAAIADRASRGETMETEIVAMKSVTLEVAEMRDTSAFVTVRFVTDQMTLVKDAEGTVIEGDATRYEPVTDLWTFARDTEARDPNWYLVATETPDEDDADA